jgi:hypothetical protein
MIKYPLDVAFAFPLATFSAASASTPATLKANTKEIPIMFGENRSVIIP